jgi:hypothetical protein
MCGKKSKMSRGIVLFLTPDFSLGTRREVSRLYNLKSKVQRLIISPNTPDPQEHRHP